MWPCSISRNACKLVTAFNLGCIMICARKCGLSGRRYIAWVKPPETDQLHTCGKFNAPNTPDLAEAWRALYAVLTTEPPPCCTICLFTLTSTFLTISQRSSHTANHMRVGALYNKQNTNCLKR